MQNRVLDAAIMDIDTKQDIGFVNLGIFNDDVEVSVIVKDAQVKQAEFRIVPAATLRFLPELCIGEVTLWVLYSIRR